MTNGTPDANGPGPPFSALGSLGEALRFLTLLPVPGLPAMTEAGIVRAIPWFPLAGALIGALLLPIGWLGETVWGAGVRAALLVAAGGIITGGLHLDGLSDTFDAVMSWRPPEHKLEIMRDSRIGAMGALALVAVLLLKYAFLAAAGADWWRGVVLAPLWGRGADINGLLFLPAARAGGLGRIFHEQVRRSDFRLASAAAAGIALIVAGPRGLLAGLLVWGCSHLLARWWTRDLGGLTGDTYGALCEIGEVIALAVFTITCL
jgi:adenosylcobinamide-GDP ribazoletransferase